jgi:AcrR family transcriptional regulator
MKHLKEDRRVQRTRQMLQQALFALLEERGYDALTVQDIAERANIGRATFYTHYADKEQLLFSTWKNLADDLSARIEPFSPSELLVERKTHSVVLFQHVADHRHLYRVLLSERGVAVIVARLRAYLIESAKRKVIAPLLPEATRPELADLLASHAAGSLIGLVIWWLDHDLPYSPEEMGRLFWQLVVPGAAQVLGLQRFLHDEGVSISSSS